MSKEGSTIGGLMDCLGTAISVALQYGVPIESLVKKFEHQRFEPMGMTTSADIPFAKSLVDYIFRWLGMEFIPGYREANAPKRTRSAGHDETKRLVGEMRYAEGEVIERPADGSREPLNPNPPNLDDSSTMAMVAKMQRRLIEAGETTRPTITEPPPPVAAVIGALDYSHAAMMGDAPACDVCGAITVRNANCYKCLNCGNSMGCS
jgi:ribonucleoside-diphosphate reductase alpha chain